MSVWIYGLVLVTSQHLWKKTDKYQIVSYWQLNPVNPIIHIWWWWFLSMFHLQVFTVSSSTLCIWLLHLVCQQACVLLAVISACSKILVHDLDLQLYCINSSLWQVFSNTWTVFILFPVLLFKKKMRYMKTPYHTAKELRAIPLNRWHLPGVTQILYLIFYIFFITESKNTHFTFQNVYWSSSGKFI